jgi:hypothetical protein
MASAIKNNESPVLHTARLQETLLLINCKPYFFIFFSAIRNLALLALLFSLVRVTAPMVSKWNRKLFRTWLALHHIPFFYKSFLPIGLLRE